jgi:hypothetical protein
MTDEEKAYIDYQLKILNRKYDLEYKFPKCDECSNREMKKRFQDSCRNAFVDILSKRTELEMIEPPELFINYHKELAATNTTFRNYASYSKVMCEDMTNEVFDRLLWAKSKEDGFRIIDDVYEKHMERANKHNKIFDAAINTHLVNINKEIDAVALELKKRGGIPWYLSFRRSIVPKVNIAYQPYFIPVKVIIDSKGSIHFVGSANTPTPIGVFSIEAEIEFETNSILVIVIGNNKYVYDMESKPFVYDFSGEYEEIIINYDGRGNLNIFIN